MCGSVRWCGSSCGVRRGWGEWVVGWWYGWVGVWLCGWRCGCVGDGMSGERRWRGWVWCLVVLLWLVVAMLIGGMREVGLWGYVVGGWGGVCGCGVM